MTESPGWINSTPLIEECSRECLKWYKGRDPLRWEYARPNVESILSVLRRRGLINQQGLELIQREMGE